MATMAKYQLKNLHIYIFNFWSAFFVYIGGAGVTLYVHNCDVHVLFK